MGSWVLVRFFSKTDPYSWGMWFFDKNHPTASFLDLARMHGFDAEAIALAGFAWRRAAQIESEYWGHVRAAREREEAARLKAAQRPPQGAMRHLPAFAALLMLGTIPPPEKDPLT